MEEIFRSLKRSIVVEGLETLCSGRDFLEWAECYQNNEELIVPGELEFIGNFKEYVLAKGFSEHISNPLYDSSLVDEICSDLN